MNSNPFKNTYKIIEYSNLSGESYYLVAYGNIFDKYFLSKDGGEWGSQEYGAKYAIKYGGKCSSLEEAKKNH